MECGGPLRAPPWLVGTVDGGPEKGRNVYDKFPGPQQAGFDGQRAVAGRADLRWVAGACDGSG
jgi:hypothetical protein